MNKNIHWYELCFFGDEDTFFDVEGLTKRVESEYGVYYTRQ